MMDALTAVLSGPVLDWAPRLTALYLIVVRPWRQYEPSGTAAYLVGKAYLLVLAAALLLPAVASAPACWLALTAFHFLWIALAYSVADNHRYLEGYWCLSLAIALWVGGHEGSRDLAWDAQYLIGLCFFFAALWKALSPSYRNGSFFVERMLFEARFLPLACWAGGIGPELPIRHREARLNLEIGRSDLEQAPVPRRLRRTGWVLTWWTLGMETLLAVLFLLPFPELALARAIALGIFVTTAYLLVPVPAFGQILLLLFLVAAQDIHQRLFALGLSASLLLFAAIAHFLERAAKHQMRRRLQAVRSPRFGWTERAKSRRLVQASDGWRLQFPPLSLSLYIPTPWVPAVERWLSLHQDFSPSDLGQMAPEIPAPELEQLWATLAGMKFLKRNS